MIQHTSAVLVTFGVIDLLQVWENSSYPLGKIRSTLAPSSGEQRRCRNTLVEFRFPVCRNDPEHFCPQKQLTTQRPPPRLRFWWEKGQLDGGKAMESGILQFICANQGVCDAEFLKYNLFFGDSINEHLSNRDKFELWFLNGQQKVLARTRLKLCRQRSCLGTCGGLHLCKNLLFTGSCSFSRQG